MTSDGTVYPAKKDWWILLLVIVCAIYLFYSAYALASQDEVDFRAMAAVLVCLICGAFPLWMVLGTRYRLGREELYIVCGPVRKRVRLADITQVYPTHNPLSSPAPSLDRLMIKTGTRWRDRVMISPEDKEGFMRRLRLLQPELRPTEKGGLERRKLADGALLDV